MAGFIPAIHALRVREKDVDGRTSPAMTKEMSVQAIE